MKYFFDVALYVVVSIAAIVAVVYITSNMSKQAGVKEVVESCEKHGVYLDKGVFMRCGVQRPEPV